MHHEERDGGEMKALPSFILFSYFFSKKSWIFFTAHLSLSLSLSLRLLTVVYGVIRLKIDVLDVLKIYGALACCAFLLVSLMKQHLKKN